MREYASVWNQERGMERKTYVVLRLKMPINRPMQATYSVEMKERMKKRKQKGGLIPWMRSVKNKKKSCWSLFLCFVSSG